LPFISCCSPETRYDGLSSSQSRMSVILSLIMEFPLLPFLSFVLVTTFTPGPNNISVAGFSMLWGFRTILPYMLGIASGAAVLFSLTAAASSLAFRTLPVIYPYLKVLGAAYILWLAYALVKGTLKQTEQTPRESSLPTYTRGLLLQFVNPKGIIYGITVFSVFIRPYVEPGALLVLLPLLLASVCLASVSVWALLGTGIQRLITSKQGRIIFSATAAALLVYSAAAILVSHA
jgi:cysteine/O-acetylserine efflux protein